jgi:large subunit ribosomal protein L5
MKKPEDKDPSAPASAPGGADARSAKAAKAGPAEGQAEAPPAGKPERARSGKDGGKKDGGKGKGKAKARKDEVDDGQPIGPAPKPRLRDRYQTEVRERLRARFRVQNVHAIPRLKKIVVNMGVKGAVENKALIESATRDLATITGQKPTVRNAKKSIANFKLREGMPIGVAVTLRGARMWEFADRLMAVVLPRIRDFRGVKAKLDGRGNYTLGLSEQSVFPEIAFDDIEATQGMDITFVTSAPNDEQGYALLKELGMPFRTEE